MTSPDEKAVGLIGKYRVERVSDPAGKHADCGYFVLDPKHDPLARIALLAYATEAAEAGYDTLANDLRGWIAVLAVERQNACGGQHGLYPAGGNYGEIRCNLCGRVAFSGDLVSVSMAAPEWYERRCEQPSSKGSSS